MHTDVLIIGGGQAGLAAAYCLSQRNVPYLVLDKGKEIGEVWKRRYDSLTLFTPRNYSELPGLRLTGNPNGFPAKDEIAAALKRYAENYRLNIRLETEVLSLKKINGEFQAETNRGMVFARHVIVATGPFQLPLIPPMSNELDPSITQMHSAHYRKPADLQPGSVLVVGSGNSGAQIAVELARSHRVVLSAGHRMTFMPLSFFGKSIFWWFDRLGILNAPSDSRIGRIVRKRPDPVFGFELKRLLKEKNRHDQAENGQSGKTHRSFCGRHEHGGGQYHLGDRISQRLRLAACPGRPGRRRKTAASKRRKPGERPLLRRAAVANVAQFRARRRSGPGRGGDRANDHRLKRHIRSGCRPFALLLIPDRFTFSE